MRVARDVLPPDTDPPPHEADESASTAAHDSPVAHTEQDASRPPPGLARGRFATSESFFFLVLAVTAIAVLAYLLRGRWQRLRQAS